MEQRKRNKALTDKGCHCLKMDVMVYSEYDMLLTYNKKEERRQGSIGPYHSLCQKALCSTSA